MQIPLTITYCPESTVYKIWHQEQGGVSPLCKEIRASHTLSKVLGGVTHQPGGVGTTPHLQLLLTTPWDQAGHWVLHTDLVAMSGIYPPPTAGSQALLAPWENTTPFAPRRLMMAKCQATSPSPPTLRVRVTQRTTTSKTARVRQKPPAMDRQHLMVKKGRNIPRSRMPLLGLVRSLVSMTQTPNQTLVMKSGPIQQKQHSRSSRGNSPPRDSRGSSGEKEPPSDEAVHNWVWLKACLLDTSLEA